MKSTLVGIILIVVGFCFLPGISQARGLINRDTQHAYVLVRIVGENTHMYGYAPAKSKSIGWFYFEGRINGYYVFLGKLIHKDGETGAALFMCKAPCTYTDFYVVTGNPPNHSWHYVAYKETLITAGLVIGSLTNDAMNHQLISDHHRVLSSILPAKYWPKKLRPIKHKH